MSGTCFRFGRVMRASVAVASIVLLLQVASGAMAQRLMIFGGEDRDVFLGCYSCNEYAPDSVFNEYGRYGSAYFPESLFNEYGSYGSRYSTISACNPYAINPPVIVDDRGGFYGYLTLNRFKLNAIRDPQVLAWLENDVCGR